MLFMIKHRNSTLQYEIQQSVFRAKSWRVPPYIIKFASGPADRMSGLLHLQKHNNNNNNNNNNRMLNIFF